MDKKTAIAAREKSTCELVKPHMTEQQIKHHADLSASNGIRRVIVANADTLTIWRQRIAALK